jgi:hypothetical protein
MTYKLAILFNSMKIFDLIFVSLLLCVASAAKSEKNLSKSSQSQINDPAKAKTLKDCTNKRFTDDFQFCCTLRVNDTKNIDKEVCINLRQKNNLEPMATINGYVNSRCKYNNYAHADGVERIWCKGSGNMDKVVMWKLDKFVRVLNPSNAERGLEACHLDSNFSRCW